VEWLKNIVNEQIWSKQASNNKQSTQNTWSRWLSVYVCCLTVQCW